MKEIFKVGDQTYIVSFSVKLRDFQKFALVFQETQIPVSETAEFPYGSAWHKTGYHQDLNAWSEAEIKKEPAAGRDDVPSEPGSRARR